MITNVAQLLTAFVEAERKVLDKEYLKHGPTIGDMYENLSQDVLARAIPVAGLEVVSGFAEDDEGNLSDELDCMLVTDKGKQVPRTTKYKVPIHAIVAIEQVKKKLYRSDVKDGFENLRSIFNLKLPTKSQKAIPGLARKAFQQIAQVPRPDDIATLPQHLQRLHHMLVIQASVPVRILLGYHGFKNETTFRTGLINLLKDLEKKKEKGWTPISLPDFIIGPRAVAMKNIAMPWGAPFQGEQLPMILTSGVISPIEVLLEAIWSRLNYMGLVGAEQFGEDLKKEQWNRLIDAKLLADGGATYDLFPAKVAAGGDPYTEWEPAIVDEPTYKLAEQLCWSSPKPVEMSKAGPAEQIAASVKVLEEAGIAAIDVANPDLLHLITEGCMCGYLPDGRMAVGDNDSGRLMRWADKHFPKRKGDIFLPPPK